MKLLQLGLVVRRPSENVFILLGLLSGEEVHLRSGILKLLIKMLLLLTVLSLTASEFLTDNLLLAQSQLLDLLLRELLPLDTVALALLCFLGAGLSNLLLLSSGGLNF